MPWIIRALLPVIGLWCSVAGVHAATEAERDEHFQTIAQVIDKELYLVAQRDLAHFTKVGYPDPGNYFADGLRLHFCSTFAVGLSGSEAESLGKEAEALLAKLQTAGDKLPALVKPYAQASGKLKKLSLRLLNPPLFNPDGVHPFVPMQPEAAAEVETRIAYLMELTTPALEKALLEVKAADEALFAEQDEKKQAARTQEAVLARWRWTDTLRLPLTVLREVSTRGEEWGISKAFIGDKVDPWLVKTLGGMAKDLSSWEWEYGFMYVPLSHNIAILNGELVRLKVKRSDLLGQLGFGSLAVTYDAVLGAFMSACDADASQLTDKAAREWLDQYKLQVWRDLLAWHVAIGTPEAATKGVALWKDLESRMEANPTWAVNSTNALKRQYMGAIYIFAARLHKQLGDSGTFAALLADVANGANKNPYAPNARGWMTATDADASSWYSQPRPLDPSRALTTARAFLAEAGKTVDEKQRNKFYTDAASTLRSGILNLPESSKDPDFIELAPTLYQLYSYTLARRGWYYRAVLASLEGLSRFRPEEWTDGSHPAWSAKGSKQLSPAGDVIRQLANASLVYSHGLISRAGSTIAGETLKESIRYLKAYDPSNVDETQQFINIIILMQEKRYVEAKDAAIEVAKAAKDNVTKLKAVRYVVEALYAHYTDELDAEKPDPKKIAAVDAELQKWVKVLHSQTDPAKIVEYDSKKMPLSEAIVHMPTADADAFRKGQQTVQTVHIGGLFKAERYAEVVAALDAGFWETCPKDPELVRKLLNYLCGSVYKLNTAEVVAYNEGTKDVKKEAGAAKAKAQLALYNTTLQGLLGNWPMYRAAHRQTIGQLKRHPGIAADAINMRKQLASAFNTVASLSDATASQIGSLAGDESVAAGLLDTWLAGKAIRDVDPGLADELASSQPGPARDQAALTWLATEAKGIFADLYFPIIIENTKNEKPDTIIGTADNLWDIDEKIKAVQLYEVYLDYLEKDGSLTAYLADTQSAFRAVAGKVAINNRLKEFWEEGGVGTLWDHLEDPPGFVTDVYAKSDYQPKEMGYKIDYARAYLKLREFQGQLAQLKSVLGPQYDEVSAQLDPYVQTIKKLALGVKVRQRLIEAYMEINKLTEAVVMATKMLEYDPLDDVVVQAFVDGVLARIGSAEPPSRELMGSARNKAATLRGQAKDRNDLRAYWTFSLQVLELSLAMGETEDIKQTLASYGRNLKSPADDLMRAVDEGFDPGRLGNGEGVVQRNGRMIGRLARADVQVIQRFLGIYEYQGNPHRPFLQLETVAFPDPDEAGTEKQVVVCTIHDKPQGSQP